MKIVICLNMRIRLFMEQCGMSYRKTDFTYLPLHLDYYLYYSIEGSSIPWNEDMLCIPNADMHYVLFAI